MAGCVPINLSLLTEESVTKPNLATHTIHNSLIKVRLHFSPPPWFWAYITQDLRETFRAVYSELMAASCGKDKVTEGDWYLHSTLHRFITVLVWSVDNICNSNVAEINKIICIKIPERFLLEWKMLYTVITFLAVISTMCGMTSTFFNPTPSRVCFHFILSKYLLLIGKWKNFFLIFR